MTAQIVTSIADLRALAKRRVPRALFDYADRGSYDKLTLARNRSDLEALTFRQRVAIDVSHSNHGGRQLDGAPSTISVLPGIAKAVQGRCEVLFDGGVQSGQDVLKVLALGARGCLIGKACLYGLAAMGGQGVTVMLEIIRNELRVTLALAGKSKVADVDRTILRY